MGNEDIINKLKTSGLYAEHLGCGGEFSLSDAFLFDGTQKFPPKAVEVQSKLQLGLSERELELKKKFKRATIGAQTTAKAVNIGKMLEKILPTMKEFKWELSDCRFLGEPIDFITFHGLARGKLESIKFVEVKSGNAHLNQHQKAVKDAVEDKKISYMEFK